MTSAGTAPAPPITEARIAAPWIVAIPNQKGGVGKTTTSLSPDRYPSLMARSNVPDRHRDEIEAEARMVAGE